MSRDEIYSHDPAYDVAEKRVSTTEQLTAAIESLSKGQGGTVFVDPNGGPYMIKAQDLGDNGSPVLIKSADASKMPKVEQVDIYSSSNLTVTGMSINSGEHGETRHVTVSDVNIYSSKNIDIVANKMTSDASGYASASKPYDAGERAATIRDSSDINFSNNTIKDYWDAVVYLEVVGLTINNNDISGLQGDGLRGRGIQDVQISYNHIHDLYGSDQSLNHTDMIQIWSTGALINTKNVDISNNIFDSGNGAAAQGIFIGNEWFDKFGHYENISIDNNVIHTGQPLGILLSSTDGASVTNNTVLWNQDSATISDANPDGQSFAPKIALGNNLNSTVTGNISWRVVDEGKIVYKDNYAISVDNQGSPNYYKKHFGDGAGSNLATPEDLFVQKDSPLYGLVGSKLNKVVGTGVDAPTSPPDGGGGNTDDETNAGDADEMILDFTNLGSDVRLWGDAEVVNTDQGKALSFDGEGDVAWLGKLGQFQEATALSVSLDFNRSSPEDTKSYLFVHDELVKLAVRTDDLIVKAANGDGSFETFRINDIGVQDQDSHNVVVLMDTEQDRLQVILDGAVVLDEIDTNFEHNDTGEQGTGWRLSGSGRFSYDGEISSFGIEEGADFRPYELIAEDSSLLL